MPFISILVVAYPPLPLQEKMQLPPFSSLKEHNCHSLIIIYQYICSLIALAFTAMVKAVVMLFRSIVNDCLACLISDAHNIIPPFLSPSNSPSI